MEHGDHPVSTMRKSVDQIITENQKRHRILAKFGVYTSDETLPNIAKARLRLAVEAADINKARAHDFARTIHRKQFSPPAKPQRQGVIRNR